MLTRDKIEAWINEIEARPPSAAPILRLIADRLLELTQRNKELLAENIALRSGERVEAYEKRITQLETQLELLKRQLGGKAILVEPEVVPQAPEIECLNLVIFHPRGEVLRLEIAPGQIKSGEVVGRFSQPFLHQDDPPRLEVVHSQEELLLAFDSGRCLTRPATSLASSDAFSLDWQAAEVLDMRGREALISLLPIAMLPLFDFCLQISRKGYVKKLPGSFFASCIANGFVGTGVRLPADQAFSLSFCSVGDRLVLVSYEGYIWNAAVENLSNTISETQRLGISDHVAAVVTLSGNPDLLIVTQTGKVIHREASWLAPSGTLKKQGQAVFSSPRREAGTRIVGAGITQENGWAFALHRKGEIMAYQLVDLVASGVLKLLGQDDELLAVAFSPPLPPKR